MTREALISICESGISWRHFNVEFDYNILETADDIATFLIEHIDHYQICQNAITTLGQHANNGDAMAMTLLAYTTNDLEKKKKLLRQAAYKGYELAIQASLNLDFFSKYQEAISFFNEGNYIAAIPLLEEMSSRNFTPALVALGSCYVNGLGVTQNAEKAAQLYFSAAKRKSIVGMYSLALCYKTGGGIEQSDELAFKWMKLAAELGDADAQVDLGTLYLTGTGVKKDASKAIAWYRKSAFQRNPNGLYGLGYCYYNAQGVEDNEENKYAGLVALKFAEEVGSAQAKDMLGQVVASMIALASGGSNEAKNLLKKYAALDKEREWERAKSRLVCRLPLCVTRSEFWALGKDVIAAKAEQEGDVEAQIYMLKDIENNPEANSGEFVKLHSLAMYYTGDLYEDELEYLLEYEDLIDVYDLTDNIEHGLVKPEEWYEFIVDKLVEECYEYGCQNEEKAAYWLVRASIEGIDVSSLEKAMKMSVGDAVETLIDKPYDYTTSSESIKWLEEKAAEGHAVAMILLACCVHHDNKIKSNALLQAAAEKGYELAAEKLSNTAKPKLYYTQDGRGLRKVKGIQGHFVVPSFVNCICEGAFQDCDSLTSVDIPKGVFSIGPDAFHGCSSLTSINIPEGVVRVGERAFSSCKNLLSVKLPHSLTEISESAFAYCNHLVSILIPTGVKSIGKDAFFQCKNLQYVAIPNTVKRIEWAFRGCTNLLEFHIHVDMREMKVGRIFRPDIPSECTLYYFPSKFKFEYTHHQEFKLFKEIVVDDEDYESVIEQMSQRIKEKEDEALLQIKNPIA